MSYEVHAERKAWKAPLLKEFQARGAQGGTATEDSVVPSVAGS